MALGGSFTYYSLYEDSTEILPPVPSQTFSLPRRTHPPGRGAKTRETLLQVGQGKVGGRPKAGTDLRQESKQILLGKECSNVDEPGVLLATKSVVACCLFLFLIGSGNPNNGKRNCSHYGGQTGCKVSGESLRSRQKRFHVLAGLLFSIRNSPGPGPCFIPHRRSTINNSFTKRCHSCPIANFLRHA